MLSPTDIADSMLLDAAFLPPAPGLEPGIVFYPPQQLSPGGWRRADSGLEVPDSARRLTLAIGEPENPRFMETRVLTVGEAIAFLMALPARGVPVRKSLTAWIVAAHIAQRLHESVMRPRGDATTDAALAKIASQMPASAHAVLVETLDADDDLLGPIAPGADTTGYRVLEAHEALVGFLDVAQHAYAVGIGLRQQPKRGASRTLAKTTLRLALPERGNEQWPLHVSFSDTLTREQLERTIDEASKRFTPLTVLVGRHTLNAEPVLLSVTEASALIGLAPELQSLGATVELPDTLTGGVAPHVSARMRFGGRGAGGKQSSSVRTGPRFRLDELVSYDLEVALGGRDVDATELRALARQAAGLVRLGGDWVALTDATREQLEKLARTVESREAHMANAQALAAALAGSAQLPGGVTATVDRVDDESLKRAIEHLRSPDRFPDIDAPQGFEGELRGYQEKGLTWLAGMASLPLGACLADDMGLGKTVQVIALLEHLRKQRDAEHTAYDAGIDPDGAGETRVEGVASEQPFRALVVCPTSLIGNWERELARFAPGLTVHVHHGPQRATRVSQVDSFDVVVTSYGLVARDREMLTSLQWDLAVFDEAQSVKNPDTEQARAVRGVRAQFRVALTGTPMENRLLELWAVLDLLNPGLLGTASAFNRRFATPIERNGDERAAQTLRAITRPFLLRRVKHDPAIVPDLPDKQEHTVACTLTAEQAALYQATADKALADVRMRDGIARRGAVLALLTRLKQICNHPAQALGQSAAAGSLAGRSGKLERLEAMLDEVVSEGDRALVFTQYAQMGELLAAHLPDVLGCEVLYLHGGVPRPQREQLIARFQGESDQPMVFVLSLKAGGLGLNLMNASHVFHYDRWWNPAVEDQATDRTHRIGQTRQIQVHKLVCAGTLEERIAAIIEDKRALAGRIIEVSGSGEGWITELGDEELEELVALSATNVEITR